MGLRLEEHGKMDWQECCDKRIVNEVKEDKNKVSAMERIALKKFEAAKKLPTEYYESSITLLYDTLRIFLEIIALKEGYKIYNHECYVSFLKEIMNQSETADEFNKVRIIRNGLNYYGKELNFEEGRETINKLKTLIKKCQN